MSVPPDFQEFLRLLTSAGVRYLLVGGYAVSAHGHHRRTDDLDVWISPDAETVEKLVEVLAAYGFPKSSFTPDQLARPGAILRMGRPPLRLEILNRISGVEFDDCFARRIVVDFDGTPVNVIDLPDLLVNKRAAGRAKDLADIEELDVTKARESKSGKAKIPAKPKPKRRRP